jgi:DNA (cytosine-5)-methyltransferase 1
MNKFNKPIAIELFAGAGGLMLGLEMAGFDSVVANEIHSDPCKTLRRNFPNAMVVEGSIIGMSGEDLLKKAGFNKEMLGDIDLIAGGPPCQGFSTAGLKNPSDSRNNLVGEFIRMVAELKPKYFLLENVSGLTTMYNGELFKNLLARIESIGYKYNYGILKAADYGVPQMRKRLIMLGARDGQPPELPKPTHVDPNNSNLFNSILKPYITIGEVFEDLQPINQGETSNSYKQKPITDYQRYLRQDAKIVYNHQASKHKPGTMQYYGLVPPGGTWLDIPKHLRNKKQGVQRLPLDGISRTVTTEPTDLLHPILNRIPTVRELARIQSFPDRFEFLGQRTTGNKMRRLGYCSQTQQVGNAVPPLLAKVIGLEIMKLLEQQSIEATQRVESAQPVVPEFAFVSP